MPIVVPSTPVSVSGNLGFSWVDVLGIEHSLSSGSFSVGHEITGLGSQPVELTLEKLPFNPGSGLHHIARQPARLTVPITVIESTFAAFCATVAQLRGWMDTGDEQAFAPGYFRVYRPDDTVREIRAYYAGGFEGDFSRIWASTGTFDIQLVAPDGTAQATADVVKIWDQTAVGTAISVTNTGELDAYPIWTVTGPAFAPGVVNSTTGRSWALSAGGGYLVGAGGYVTVDCRPESLRDVLPVLDQAGVSRFPYMTAASSIRKMLLLPGVNNLGINAGSMSSATRFQVAFRPRYRALL